MHFFYFICERKFYARTDVTITRHRKSTLSKQGKTFLVNPRHIPGRLVQFYVLNEHIFTKHFIYRIFNRCLFRGSCGQQNWNHVHCLVLGLKVLCVRVILRSGKMAFQRQSYSASLL